MKRAYSDPPYFGYAKFYADHPEHLVWNELDTHRQHIEQLCDEYDSWVLSMTSGNLHDILPLCPRDARVGAWVKPFASFKPGVNPGYCWEPVIFWHPRSKRLRTEHTVRDFTWPAIEDPAVACNIALKKGLVGAKPEGFCMWVFDLLGLEIDDDFVDCFPGSGQVALAYRKWLKQQFAALAAIKTAETAA